MIAVGGKISASVGKGRIIRAIVDADRAVIVDMNVTERRGDGHCSHPFILLLSK